MKAENELFRYLQNNDSAYPNFVCVSVHDFGAYRLKVTCDVRANGYISIITIDALQEGSFKWNPIYDCRDRPFTSSLEISGEEAQLNYCREIEAPHIERVIQIIDGK